MSSSRQKPHAGWTVGEVAGRIQHTLIRTGATDDEIVRHCRECLKLPHYRPLFIGLSMPADEVARVRGRLSGEDWDEESGGFRNSYGVGWQLGEGTFSGTGDRIGSWLEV